MKINDINDVQIETVEGWLITAKFTPWSDKVEVWIAKRDGKDISIFHFNEKGDMVSTTYKEGSLTEPTMTINRFIWEGLQQAFQGIKETPDKKAVDAELIATKFHLEDMRKLVFKNK